MDRNRIKFFIDLAMGISFVISAISGFARNGKLHYWSSVLLILFVIIHLFLNFNWIKCMIKNLLFLRGEKNE